jgi:hypothetical protein
LPACKSTSSLTHDSYCQVTETIKFPAAELEALKKAPTASRGILRENRKRERICV